MHLKRICFYLVVITPAFFLVVLAILVGRDLHDLRSLSMERITLDLQARMAKREPKSFPLPDAVYTLDPAKKTIFMFGESSLVLSDGGTFPDYVGQRSARLQTVNFGVSGIDSLSVRQRIKEVLQAARPDVIVLYYGHNDYNNPYNGFIMPTYFKKFDELLALPYLLHDKDRPEGVILSNDWYWYSRLIRPRLIRTFERFHLLDINSDDYTPVNQLILENFIVNNEEILAMAAAKKIPVVLITPVGNLRAEPFGDVHTTTALYLRGMSSPHYRESLDLLKQARDAELFTYDLRAKSPLIDYLRQLKRPGVHVLDLEEKLEALHFEFGYGEFLDYFHFSDRTHRMLAGIIYDFMVERHLTVPERRSNGEH